MDLMAVIIIIAVMIKMPVMTIMAKIASSTYCTCLKGLFYVTFAL